MPPIATSGFSSSARQRRTSSTPTTGSGLRFDAVRKTGPERDIIDGLAAGRAELRARCGWKSRGSRPAPISLRASRGGRSSWPDVQTGLEQHGEIGAVVDDEGRARLAARRATRLAVVEDRAAPVRFVADLQDRRAAVEEGAPRRFPAKCRAPRAIPCRESGRPGANALKRL